MSKSSYNHFVIKVDTNNAIEIVADSSFDNNRKKIYAKTTGGIALIIDIIALKGP